MIPKILPTFPSIPSPANFHLPDLSPVLPSVALPSFTPATFGNRWKGEMIIDERTGTFNYQHFYHLALDIINSDIGAATLTTLTLFGGPVSTLAIIALTGSIVLTKGLELAENWSTRSTNENLWMTAAFAGQLALGITSGMVGQSFSTGAKFLLAEGAERASSLALKKLITNKVVVTATTRLAESFAFNGFQAIFDQTQREHFSLGKIVRSAIWFEASARAMQWNIGWRGPQTSSRNILLKGQNWIEGALVGTTVDYAISNIFHTLGFESAPVAGFREYLSSSVPNMALMHLGNNIALASFSNRLGQVDEIQQTRLTETYTAARRDLQYIQNIEGVNEILNSNRPFAALDFLGEATVLMGELLRQAGYPSVIAFGSRGNATALAEDFAKGHHASFGDLPLQTGVLPSTKYGPKDRLWVVPADTQADLVRECRTKAEFTFFNGATAAVPALYTSERIGDMQTEGHYVAHMMKGIIAYDDATGFSQAKTPREYMTAMHEEAGKGKIPLVMWVGFDGAKATMKGSKRVSRVSDDDTAVEILITCKESNGISTDIAKNTAIRHAALVAKMKPEDGITKYIDGSGVEHSHSAPGRYEVRVFENRTLPRPVKFRAVWAPEVVRAQEFIAIAKNMWTSVFGHEIHKWQSEKIREKKEWSPILEHEQIIHEGRIRKALEDEMRKALSEFEGIDPNLTAMLRENEVDWMECSSFVPGGREMAYKRRQAILNTPSTKRETIEKLIEEYKTGPNPYVTRNPYNGDLSTLGWELAKSGKINHAADLKPPKMVTEGELAIAAIRKRWTGELPDYLKAHEVVLLANRSPVPITKDLKRGILRLQANLWKNFENRKPSDVIAVSETLRNLFGKYAADEQLRIRINDDLALDRIQKITKEITENLKLFEVKVREVDHTVMSSDDRKQTLWASSRLQHLVNLIHQLPHLSDNQEFNTVVGQMRETAREMHINFKQQPDNLKDKREPLPAK